MRMEDWIHKNVIGGSCIVYIFQKLIQSIYILAAITVLYEACRYGYAIDQDDTWCRVFTTNHLKILEYGQDLRYFWKYGWGRPINYTPSCHLLQDIVAAIQYVQMYIT